ncbi:hypothetical protein [Microbacterium sp. BF1]|nr:hypothetical protein [Microbacterium sp. BF1]
MAAVDTVVLTDWVSRFGAAVTEKRDWLTELDSAARSGSSSCPTA